jgi:endonuclease/exonuclease/phosphatase family metal-dependent hydrolase
MLRATMTTAAASVVMVTTMLGSAPADAAYTSSTPRGLHEVSATQTTMTLGWQAVSRAGAYRVQVSLSRSMSSARYFQFTGTTGVLRGLTPSRRYYFRVSVINARTGVRVSAYTGSLFPSAVTPRIATPTGLAVASTTSSGVNLRWNASEGATRYGIVASTSATFATPASYASVTTSKTLNGQQPNTTYYFRVRAIRSDGTGLTSYSAAVSGRTKAVAPTVVTSTGPSDVRVGSFNAVTASGDRTEGSRLPWADRRAPIVSDILGEKVDVIGVQEVNQSYTLASRMVSGANQFLDLKNGLNEAGGTYAITNENSYNCENSTTSYKCVYRYRGASGGDRIYYNTSTLTRISQGAYAYPTQNVNTPTVTYALAYAVFQVKATGARFLFTTTHLDPPDRTVRVAQWHELITKVNQLKGSLPVVNVGDYNTQKFDTICETMLPAMKAAGYGDVLNQSYATNPVAHPRARTSINGWINSNNRWNRDTTTYSYPYNHTKTGNSIDWIFASNALPVKEFKMVLDYDPVTLQVRGTMPSDHNMVRATLTLP